MYGERSIDISAKGHSALPFGVGATGRDAFLRRLPVAAPAVATTAAVLLLLQGEGQAGRAQEIETCQQGGTATNHFLALF